MPVFCRHVMPRRTKQQLIALNVIVTLARIAELHIRIQQRRRNDLILRKMMAVKKEADAEMGEKDSECGS
jgi:hypothetical protein